MLRAKVLVVGAIAALALSSATVATAQVVIGTPSCTVSTTVLETSVNCVGRITGLPRGITHVELTLAYVCVNRFHRDPMTSRVGADLGTDAHGNLSFNLTAVAAPCAAGLTPVPQSVTITAFQNGVELARIVVPLA